MILNKIAKLLIFILYKYVLPKNVFGIIKNFVDK